MKHKSAPLLAAIAAALPLQALALGLGSITLDSALNEPLDARIKLEAVRGTDVQDIRVGLAESEDFQRAGLDRPYLLSRLRFQVRQDASGGAYISVSSQQPVREPFLSFLVEVNWPAGRLLREYTVLLDPPIYSAAARRSVTPPQAQPRAQAPAAQPAAPARPSPAPAAGPAPMAAAYQAGRYGPVQRNETLWSIASRVRPSEAVSIQQMMLAIQEANPEAFAEGNINGLKAGQILNIPQDVETGGQAEAMAEVRRQYAQWDEYRQMAAASPGPRVAGTAGEGTGSPARTTAPDAQLKLLSPGDGEAGAGGGGTAALRKELAMLEEEASSAKAESEELRSRLADTEQMLEDFKRLVELKDENIAALQQRIGEAAKAEAREDTLPEPAPAAPDEPEMPAEMAEDEGVDPLAALEADLAGAGDEGAAPDMDEAEPETPAAPEEEMPDFELPEMEAGPADEAAEASAAEEPEPTPAPAEPPAPAQKPLPKPPLPPPAAPAPTGFLDSLPVSPVALGGGLAALIALVAGGLLLKRRRKDKGDDASAASAPAPAEAVEEPAEEAPAAAPATPAGSEELGDTARFEGGESEAAADEFSDTLIQEPQEDDALDEVNVYLAYERYDQAEQLVRKAIAEHPDRDHYYLKLLEIHHAARNPEAYERDAERLRERVGDDHEMMDKARGWWAELNTGRALFAGAAAGAGLGAAAATFAEEGPGAEDTVQMDAEQAAAAEGLDFDLGLTDDEQPEGAAGDDGLDLELDTDEGDFGGSAEGLDEGLDFDLGDLETGSEESDEGGLEGLDFDLGEMDEAPPSETQTLEQEPPEPASEMDEGLDFDLGEPEAETLEPEESPEERTDEEGLDFDLDEAPEEPPAAGEVTDESRGPVDLDTEEMEAPGAPDAEAEAWDGGLDFEGGEQPDEDRASAGEAQGDDLDFDLGEVPEEPSSEVSAEEGLDFDLGEMGEEETPERPEAGDDEGALDFDLGEGMPESDETPVPDAGDEGLDFDLGEATEAPNPEAEPEPREPPVTSGEDEGLDFDLGMEEPRGDTSEDDGIDFDLGEGEPEPSGEPPLRLDETTADLEPPPEGAGAAEAAEAGEDEAEIDFDLDLGFDEDAPEATLSLGQEGGGDIDEVGTKLDLAQAYVDMGDTEGARAILNEVMGEGSDEQKSEAQELLNKLG